MTKIKVHVASTLPDQRARICRMVLGLADLELIGMSATLSETFNLCEASEPDVVIATEEMSRVGEWATMKSLFYALRTGWIIARSGDTPANGCNASDPIDFVMGPETSPAGLALLVAKVLKMTRGNRTGLSTGLGSVNNRQPLVVMGASTGGVDALLAVLSEFPADCPPTLIVQHTGKGFSEGLIRLLSRRCKPSVVEARTGVSVVPGHVYVAAGSDGHLVLASKGLLECQIRQGDPVSGHCPSVDVLFQSAVPRAPNVVGVILTGMGQDGASGLLSLYRAGCITIGQDEATSVVYGMPKAAFNMGAVQRQVPLSRIGTEILSACREIGSDATAPLRPRSAGH